MIQVIHACGVVHFLPTILQPIDDALPLTSLRSGMRFTTIKILKLQARLKCLCLFCLRSVLFARRACVLPCQGSRRDVSKKECSKNASRSRLSVEGAPRMLEKVTFDANLENLVKIEKSSFCNKNKKLGCSSDRCALTRLGSKLMSGRERVSWRNRLPLMNDFW